MMPRLISVCLLLCALWSLPLRATEAPDTRVLFINSYHRGYSWSDGIEEGLREGLKASEKRIELSIEYLDSRRFAYDTQIELLAKAFEAKYAQYRPDLVVVSDNAAFDFAIRYRARLFPTQPIVFCGYNNFRPEVIEGLRNITGVNEEIAIEDTVAMALKIHPRTRTLAFVTSTGDASSKRIGEVAEQSAFPALRKRFEVVEMKDLSVEEIRKRLAELPRDSLLFLSGQTTDQSTGRALTPPENGVLLTAASPFPTYSFWDFHLGHGTLGGHIITGPEQGHAAADMALRILAGTPADSIPVRMTTPTRDVFDYNAMQRFGVRMKDLPAEAQIINRPFSLWDSYRWQMIGVIALLAVETALIALLLHISRGRRKALAALDEERALLEQRVAERTHALRIANEQLADISMTDSLTGLPNRRRLDEVLDAEIARLRRSGGCLSMIMLDVDFFKPFNDTYGHVDGDDCLRQVAAVISRQAHRATDLAARFGGEEFALVLPDTDAPGAAALAERIRAGIEQLAIPHRASKVADHVTASLGVITLLPATLPAREDVIRRVDTQLYRAKLEGRNRVATHDAAQIDD